MANIEIVGASKPNQDGIAEALLLGRHFGEHASAGALETTHPAADYNGARATVAGVLYEARNGAWSPVSGDGLTLSNYREALGNTTTSGNITLTLTNPVQRIVLDAIRTITAPADPGAVAASLTLILLCQTFTPVWSGITWLTPGGVAPVLNTGTGKRNVITLVWDDNAGGSGTWLGFHAGSEA